MSIEKLSEFNSVLNAGQLDRVKQLTQELSPIQQAWLSGYLAASSELALTGQPAVSAQAAPASVLTILVGSQTGNASGVADQLETQAQHLGLAVERISMGDFKPANLKKIQYLAVLVSTHGEGDPPDDAEQLHKFLASKRAPKLDKLQYSVLAFGDSSYEFFCQTGKDFDERLAALGAKAVTPRVDLDVDYDDDAKRWSEALLEQLKDKMGEPASATVVPMPGVNAQASQYSKQNPFSANVLAVQKITGRDSVKDIRHIELSLEESGLSYQPGDALGVWFHNEKNLVTNLLALLHIRPDTQVKLGDEELEVEEALIKKLELTQSYPGFVKAYAELAAADELKALLEDKAALRAYLNERQIIDIVKAHPAQITAQELVDSLRKITPRLYSIASAQSEVEDEVHLTLGVVRYHAHGSEHLGGASGYLAERVAEGDEVSVYIEANKHFKLPAAETPVIMIGPGTGIAPFRAFLQEREATGANGDNWLFFGNPHFTQDFLYQTEIQQYLNSGLLSRLDLAFSRDQQEKIYVQHRILQQAESLWQWLERGAVIYVCGDAEHMAKDVHQALIEVIQTQGNKSPEEAEAFLNELKQDKRYQKDVY